jgi:hypothetical protein
MSVSVRVSDHVSTDLVLLCNKFSQIFTKSIISPFDLFFRSLPYFMQIGDKCQVNLRELNSLNCLIADLRNISCTNADVSN